MLWFNFLIIKIVSSAYNKAVRVKFAIGPGVLLQIEIASAIFPLFIILKIPFKKYLV